MKKGEMIATRDAFSRALVEFGKDNERVVALDADLAKSTMSARFRDVAPERFFECGIAEADMVDTAAGLSLTGKIPFACSFAVFTAGRACEQIRNTIAYPKLNVKVCGSHGGLGVGPDGASHQAVEDLALMATLPNMTVLNPADGVEMRAAVKAAIEYNGPVYLRLGRNLVPVIFDEETYTFEIGKGKIIREGTDVSLVATGMMVSVAMQAAEILEKDGISAEIVDIATIQPIDRELLIKTAKKTGRVVVMEEGLTFSGLGSIVATVLSESCPVPMRYVGLDSFGESGEAEELFERYGLTAENTVKKVKELF